MPEGPEIHIAARFINQSAEKFKFGGRIVKSEVSAKNPDVTWLAKEYTLFGEARGKELKVHLQDASNPKNKTHILFRFGMSGCIKLTSVADLPKHAHLQFYTLDKKFPQVLSFVDYRRFGRWEVEGEWGKDRGPDPMYEHAAFRQNVLDNLDNAAFSRPICETLLNQKYFNGIGNYLRAEILFRCQIKPFDMAREVLEPCLTTTTTTTKKKAKSPDVLEMCRIVPLEVLALESGKEYNSDDSQKSQDTFSEWLQCYYVEGMRNLQDGNGRTMWFRGDPGKMAPKVKKEKGRRGKKGKQIPQSGEDPVESKVKIEPVDFTESTEKKKFKIKEEKPVLAEVETKIIRNPRKRKQIKREEDEIEAKSEVKVRNVKGTSSAVKKEKSKRKRK